MSDELTPEQRDKGKYNNGAWIVVKKAIQPRQLFMIDEPLFIFFNGKQAEEYLKKENHARGLKSQPLLKMYPVSIKMPYVFQDFKNQLEIYYNE